MIDAAEQIVASQGLASMTFAEVQQRSAQSNKSAAAYHFGSREGLINAVLDLRMGPVDSRRGLLLEEHSGVTLDARAIAEIFVRPLAAETVCRPDSHYARFLAQVLVDPTLSQLVLGHLGAKSFRQLEDAHRALSHLPSPLVEARFAAMVGLAVISLATWEAHRNKATVIEAIVEDLVTTCTAVLMA